MKTKFLSLFVALVATTALWAQNNVITYTATSKQSGYYGSLDVGKTTFGSTITSHFFSNGTGTIICSGEITMIGELAFEDCDGLTSVTIPNSVKTIGTGAFYGCIGLTSVTIPNSVTTIGAGAFYGCIGLTSVTIPNSVTTIGDYAFLSCSGLTSVTIPNSVTTIGDGAFSDCSGLTSVEIPNSVTTIGGNAFSGCYGLTSPIYNTNCFAYMPTFYKDEYTIPSGIKQIVGGAFFGCIGLTSVTIPNSVTTIGNNAFYNCSGLTSVTIPNSVTTIGDFAFNIVNNIVYNGTATGSPWGAKCVNGYVEGFLVYSDASKTKLCGCSSSALGKITIPNSVTTIGEYAFAYCYGLTSVTIPNSVTTIGDFAFYCCEGLTSVTIPNSVTSIGERAFAGCRGLTSVTIPNSVTTIGYYAFYGCSGLTSVTIGNSVTTIGMSAFSNCSGLTSVTIPNSVTMVGYDAFYNVNNIVYSGTATGSPWGAKCINGYVDGYLVYSDATKTILCGCSTVATGAIVIPNSVTTIGYGAFRDCSGLTSVTIPNSVTMIGIEAFRYCSSIEKVYIHVPNPYPFETKDPEVIVNPIITKAFTATTPQYILQNVGQISIDNTPTCVLVHVDLSKMETSRYTKMALDFAGTKYELSAKESTVILTGLTPASTNRATFYSQLVGESQWREGVTIDLTTSALTLTTLTPKVVSAGTAIVAAETNISDYETNVGFEWRKENAPAGAASKSGAAIMCNGIMEGRLLNLGTDWWKVRPYYEAADGTRYYGEWEYIDPTDASYFEPTVHTYALVTDPTANKVQMRGYVMTGTDDVTEQGFEYWFKGAKAPRRVASATPDSVYRVQASGQVMTAVLEDLAYSTTYTCRAYAVAGGKTYYGEEVQFLTPEDPRPIYTLYVMAGENGSVNTDVSGQYREGETVTLTATAEQGFRFLQWSDGNTDNPRQLTITANTELVAIFELGDGLEELIIDNGASAHSDKCTVRKFIRNNQLYILRNGKLYNAHGGVMR